MSRLLLAAAALSLIAACSASANVNAPASATLTPAASTTPVAPPVVVAAAPVERVSATRAQPARFTCAIRTRSTANGLLIEAVGSSNARLSGEYHLVITKSGGGGSSDVTQGGPFNASPGSSLTLGSAEIGLDRGDRYHAVLTIRDESGVICREERRS